MKATKVRIGVGAIVLAGALWLALHAHRDAKSAVASRPALPVASEPAAQVSPEQAREDTAPAPVRPRAEEQPGMVAPLEVSSAAPAPSAEKTVAFKYEPNLERALELASDRAQLTDRWSSEKRDPSWRAAAEARLHTTFVERGIDPSAVSDIDCHATICRFVARTSSKTKTDVDGLIQAARAIDEQTWTMPEEQEVGYSVEVFFPREGYRLSSGGGRVDEPVRVADTSN